jgi:hypothetical protein
MLGSPLRIIDQVAWRYATAGVMARRWSRGIPIDVLRDKA